MSYDVVFDMRAGYLHAVVTGINSRANVTAYLAEITERCAATGCDRVLIEEHLEGPRLGFSEVYEIASREGHDAPDSFPQVAFVDVNAAGTAMDFAGEVSRNRGIPVQVFNDVDAAAQWLQSQADEA